VGLGGVDADTRTSKAHVASPKHCRWQHVTLLAGAREASCASVGVEADFDATRFCIFS
jgi:hypothetical protein